MRITVLLLAVAAMLPAEPPFENFLHTSAGDLKGIVHLLDRADIVGVQVVYSWDLLEFEKDQYNFAQIDRDLALAQLHHKKLFLQVQDRFFTPEAKHIPQDLRKYLVPQIDNPGENKAPVMGWVAEQWNPLVRTRYQGLLQALADQFDGRVYGVNLPESAIDIDRKHDKTGFSCDGYFDAEMENLTYAKRVFKHSYVVQYVNFWPCEWNNDHGYMARVFALAAKIGVGLGGPDIVPDRKAHMDNSYPFFARFKDKLNLVAMAVQEPTLTYKNPKTGKRFTKAEFETFARDYLGARIIFWSPSAPWLQ